MDIFKELEEIKESVDSMDCEEFDAMLERCGIDHIASSECSSYLLGNQIDFNFANLKEEYVFDSENYHMHANNSFYPYSTDKEAA